MELNIIESPKADVNPNKKIKFTNGQMYEYEIYDLVDEYSPLLKQKLEPFDFKFPPIPPKYLAFSLIETMQKRRGVGLAANQCGLPYRVFVMGAEGIGFACFNPEILETSGEEVFEEGCLSSPGLFLPIKRPAAIKIKYTDMNGVDKIDEFKGFSARIFLHEYDHLNGIVYTSKVSPIILDRQKKKIKSNVKKLTAQRKSIEKSKKEAQKAG